MNKKTNYSLASTTWDSKEYDAMQKVIDSSMFTMGKNVNEFEKNFSIKFNSKYSVMVNSGSSANLLMIASLFFTNDGRYKLKRGDEIIVPSVSWSTTYYPLLQYGLKVKFVDINLNTLNFDLNSLENAVTEKTKAIFIVNLLGNSNDFERIDEIISKKNKNIIKLLDNCESMGSKFKGKNTGEYVLISSYSTFFSHHISTMEGGVITTDNEELYHILLSLRAHGWTRQLPNNNLVTGQKSSNPFDESFKFVLPGYNVRPMELSGAIGIEQLKKLDDLVYQRRQNAQTFVDLFSDFDNFIIQKEIGDSSWFGFSLIINPNSTLDRNLIIQKLENNNIETRPVVAGNFVKNPVIKYFDYEVENNLKNSDIVHTNGFFVGNHHYCLKDQLFLLREVLDNE